MALEWVCAAVCPPFCWSEWSGASRVSCAQAGRGSASSSTPCLPLAMPVVNLVPEHRLLEAAAQPLACCVALGCLGTSLSPVFPVCWVE